MDIFSKFVGPRSPSVRIAKCPQCGWAFATLTPGDHHPEVEALREHLLSRHSSRSSVAQVMAMSAAAPD